MVVMSLATPLPASPQVEGFFDPVTGAVSYGVLASAGSACAIIDSVLDYDPKSGRTSTTSADRVIDFVRMRSARDATLAMSVLMLPAVQINIRAGEMPPAGANGVAYLKISLNAV
jgi:hypothetical protein